MSTQSYEFLKAWREKAKPIQTRLAAVKLTTGRDELAEALSESTPIAAVETPAIDADAFVATLTEAAALFAEQRPDAAAGVTALQAALTKTGPDDRQQLVVSSLVYNVDGLSQWAAQNAVDAAVLLTLSQLALQPYLAKYGQGAAKKAPLSNWRNNYCPVCGRQPDVARIDPDNLRYLHCPTCDTQWEHHRLNCVRCGCDDIKKVNILIDEKSEPWRVEVCDDCGDYTKTLDQRHGGVLAMPKIDLFLEDARTVRLDLLAEHEGYRRGGRVQ